MTIPDGLVSIGYYTRPQIQIMRDAGIRAYIDSHFTVFNGEYCEVYVEQNIKDAQALHRRLKTFGRFADMAEVDFIINTMYKEK